MPLAQPLPLLRRQIEEILTEDLAAALNALKELLPEGSDKHRTVLELRARFNDANKQSFRGIITGEQLQLVYNQVRSAVFDLLEGLAEADFEPPATTGAAAGTSPAKQGSVLYHVPHRMPLRKPSICKVRVALDEDAILEDIELDDDVRLRSRVEVSDMMQAELLDPEGEVFAIRPLSAVKQLVRDTGYTQWVFNVTPLVEGEHQLLVKVSMMEYMEKLGEYVPREVSILETITIVTETLAPSDSDDTPLKATGDRFALGPVEAPRAFEATAPASHVPPQPAPPPRSRPSTPTGLRAVALSLVFLLVGTTATWAFTPPPVRDWWVASLRDSAEAYAGYIEKYKAEAPPQLENAYVKKAEKTGELSDLRAYQYRYPQGQYREQVAEKVAALETEAVESIRQQPDAGKISRFVQDFPESERLPALREAVAERAELLPVVENAYVASIQAQPSAQKVTAYLRDFPQSERLPEVTQAVAAKREVLREVQPALEQAWLKKMEPNPTKPQAEAFLKQFPVPTQREKFEQILAKKPALRNQFLQKMEIAAEEQKIREEAERRRAAEEAAEKARLEALQRRALEEKDATERARLEKEAAQEAERQRIEAETRRDTDADGVPDKTDQCPNEKGDAANNGCPAPEPAPKDKKSGLDLVSVQGGTFTMGCQEGRDEDCESNEKPAHTVTLSTFQIGSYEVTQADWREVMGSNPSNFKGCDDCPVENVSWNEVQDFIKTLNQRTANGKKYRLPTEAEWEYAAQGGHKMPKDVSMMSAYAGGDDIGKVAWYDANSGDKTHPVGLKTPNALGLYDMSGNVYEWCADWYGDYAEGAQSNPTGPKSGSLRVRRGGSWFYDALTCRVASRNLSTPEIRNFNLGFRLASSPQ